MKFSIALILISLSSTIFALNLSTNDALNVKEIMQKYDKANLAEDQIVDLNMELTNDRGRTRTRQITWTTIMENNNRNSLIRFNAPADVKGTGFLEIENTGREDDQWLYLPALKRVRRISASNDADSFMGSDFAYEDISREKLAEYTYVLKGEKEVAGRKCYIIEAKPTGARVANTGYAKRVLYICATTYMSVKVDYYDKKGAHSKTLMTEDIRKVGSKWRGHKLTMTNLATKHKTVLAFSDFKVEAGVEKNVFSRQYLEKV